MKNKSPIEENKEKFEASTLHLKEHQFWVVDSFASNIYFITKRKSCLKVS